ncbi:MAG: SDR family oxidoreductase [Anaerolineae bacterium]
MHVLDGRTAVFSGLSSEFAGPLIMALASQGARLVLVDRESELIEQQVSVARAHAASVTGLVCKLSEGAIQALNRQIADEVGPVDVLVTCPPDRLYYPSPNPVYPEFRDWISDALDHAFLWSMAALPSMRTRRSGVIVHVTGLCGMGGWRDWAPAGAAFAGIHNLIQTLALEYAEDGVRINGLVPGVTETLAFRIADTLPAEKRDALHRRVPMSRWLTHGDLAHALLYLVQPSSSYVTGERLVVDGGWDSWGRLYAAARS